EVVADQALPAGVREHDVDVEQDRALAAGHVPQDVVQRGRRALGKTVEIARQAEPRVRRIEPPEGPLAGRDLELQRGEAVVDGEGARPRFERPGTVVRGESVALAHGAPPGHLLLWPEPGPVRRERGRPL